MDNKTRTLSQCNFANVRLPLDFKSGGRWGVEKGFEEKDSGRIGKWLNITALEEFNTYLQIAFVNGAMWVRLSAQIYLEVEEFERVGLNLKVLCEIIRKGEVELSEL